MATTRKPSTLAILLVLLLAGTLPSQAASTGQITVDLVFSADRMGREVLGTTRGIGTGTFAETATPSFFDVFFDYLAGAVPEIGVPPFIAKGEGLLRADPDGGRMDLRVTSLTDLQGKPLPVVDPSNDGTPDIFELQLVVNRFGFDRAGMIQVPGTSAFLVQPVELQLAGGQSVFLPRRDHRIQGAEPSGVLLLGAALGVAAAMSRGCRRRFERPRSRKT